MSTTDLSNPTTPGTTTTIDPTPTTATITDDTPIDPTTLATDGTNSQAILDLNSANAQFTKLNANDSLDTLIAAWHFLQVFATVCVKLPSSSTRPPSGNPDITPLANALGVKNPGKYGFLTKMAIAYNALHDSGTDFNENVFPNIVNLASNDMATFAVSACDMTGLPGVFTTIVNTIDKINTDLKAAEEKNPAITPQQKADIINEQVKNNTLIDLIESLQSTAVSGASNAAAVVKQLNTYKDSLTTAHGLLTDTDTAIQTEFGDVQTQINNDNSNIQAMNAAVAELHKEYTHDVVIATTTVTYAWAMFPLGLIAAGVVAGVYGSKATAALRAIDTDNSIIKTDNEEIATLKTTQKLQTIAHRGVFSLMTYTDQAKTQVTTVQNSWNGINSGLEVMKNFISGTTVKGGSGSDIHLQALNTVYREVKIAAITWNTKIQPSMQALINNPYITVKDDVTTVQDALNFLNSPA